MRIRDAYTRLDRTGISATKTAEAKATKAGATKAGSTGKATPGEGVTVAVSSKAMALAQAADLSQNPKVSELRDAVRNGTLQIDARKIANKLLGEEA